jgi:hypothetical protein
MTRPQSPAPCQLVWQEHKSPGADDKVCLAFTALFDSNEFNVNRGRSYMKALGLDWGIAANFGKTKAEFCGLARAA